MLILTRSIIYRTSYTQRQNSVKLAQAEQMCTKEN